MLKKKISSALAIVLCLLAVLFSFAPSTRAAQAKQSEEAAAINTFKTFVKYVTTEDPRTFSIVSELTKAVTAEAAADVVMDNPQFREMCAGMSRSDIVQELRAEFENPAQETASNFAKEMKAKEREEKKRAKLSADSADTVDDPVASDRSTVSA